MPYFMVTPAVSLKLTPDSWFVSPATMSQLTQQSSPTLNPARDHHDAASAAKTTYKIAL
jgi:hypothetical protein